MFTYSSTHLYACPLLYCTKSDSKLDPHNTDTVWNERFSPASQERALQTLCWELPLSLRTSWEALWIELIAIFQKVQKIARFNHEMRAFANKMPEAATSIVSVRGNSLAWYGTHSSYSW